MIRLFDTCVSKVGGGWGISCLLLGPSKEGWWIVLRSVVGKVMWVGRATVFLVGLAVILAALFGLASTALGANGDSLRLGLGNAATNTTSLGGVLGANGAMLRLANKNDGADDTALRLEVQAGEAPMSVNSGTRVDGLNADRVDGQDVDRIGVNGLQRVEAVSDENSVSSKQATASCPSGKVLVGTGFDIFGGKSGSSPNQQTDVMMDFVIPGSTSVTAAAYEDEATGASWSVRAIAICATAGTP